MYGCYKLSTVKTCYQSPSERVSMRIRIRGHACAPIYYDNKLTVLHLPSPHNSNKI